MLIVPHALHCVDGCIFVFTSFDTVCCFGFIQCQVPPPPQSVVLVSFSAQHPPPPPPPKKKKKKKNYYFIRFSFFVKIQNSLTRELTVIRVVGLPSPPTFPPIIFLSDLVLAPSSLHQPPPDKGHTVREYYGATGVFCPACGALVPSIKGIYLFSFLSPSLWETARYRLIYCLKGPLNPKQPTIQQL